VSTRYSLKLPDHAAKSGAISDGTYNPGSKSGSQDDSLLHAWPPGRIRLLAQILVPVFVLAGAFGIYQYMKITKPQAATRAPQEVIFPVHSLSVVSVNDQPVLTLYGTTVAGRQVELRALVAGKVHKTGPQLLTGGEVKAGDMLLEIDTFDYEVDVSEAQSRLAEARAKLVETEASLEVERGNLISANEQLRLAQTDLDRAKALDTRGTVSKRTVDDRRLTL